MITDTEIKTKGFQALTDALGAVEAEKFVTLVMRERFDYTQWRKDLWPLESIEEISSAAMKHRKLTQKQGAGTTGRTSVSSRRPKPRS